jgi:hypothetical protein
MESKARPGHPPLGHHHHRGGEEGGREVGRDERDGRRRFQPWNSQGQCAGFFYHAPQARSGFLSSSGEGERETEQTGRRKLGAYRVRAE